MTAFKTWICHFALYKTHIFTSVNLVLITPPPPHKILLTIRSICIKGPIGLEKNGFPGLFFSFLYIYNSESIVCS